MLAYDDCVQKLEEDLKSKSIFDASISFQHNKIYNEILEIIHSEVDSRVRLHKKMSAYVGREFYSNLSKEFKKVINLAVSNYFSDIL